MKIVAVGDVSFRDGDIENTRKTFQNIKDQRPDLILMLGDHFYKKDPDDVNRFFLNEFGNDIDKKKIRPLIGNHDDDDEGKLDRDEAKVVWSNLIEKCLKDVDGVQLVPKDNNPNSQEKERYYAFTTKATETTGKVCFIMLYTATSYIDKRKQKEFAFRKLLLASSDPTIDWIIVCYHKPSVTLNTDGGHAPESGMAVIYHDIFDHFGVDMILTGHNHNYQRTKLVKNNPEHETEPKVVSENDVYDTRKGRVFMVVGSGGRESEGFLPPERDYIKFKNPEENVGNDEKYGILSLEFTNKTMEGKFISNKKVQEVRKIIDEFKIDKSGIMDSHECGDPEHLHWDEATQSCVHNDSSGFERGPDAEEIDKITCAKKTT